MRSLCRDAYRVRVSFFAFYDAAGFFGEPKPAPGARVCFVPDKLFAARERETGRPVDRHLVGDEGLVVDEVVGDVLVWPASLWRVGDLERPVRLQPGNRWVRCRAFTVVEQVPEWLVAGPCGHAVKWVIDQARALSSDL
jgi:hypothetical protein